MRAKSLRLVLNPLISAFHFCSKGAICREDDVVIAERTPIQFLGLPMNHVYAKSVTTIDFGFDLSCPLAN